MTQAYQKRETVSETVTIAFKRHILEESSGFASEPMADAFRVNLLSRMLDRYEELLGKGLGEQTAMYRTMHEFDDIAVQMRDMGFEEIAPDEASSRWPQLSEAEAERYMHERDVYMHKNALGVFLCVACLVPMMLFAALSEVFWLAEDFLALFGLAGMFAMIGTGVYMMVTAAKPKEEKRMKEGCFSLGQKLHSKLAKMKESIETKARKRVGRGVALCVTSIIPMLAGAMIDEISYSEAGSMFGVAGMFLMIAAGVYEMVMAGGEKTTLKRLLSEKE